MSLYSGLKTTAKRLLTQYGQSVTLSYYRDKTFDPILGNHHGGTTKTEIGKGAIFNYSKREIDGESVLESDGNLYLSIDVQPASGDTITIDGADWHIVGVNDSNPAGVSVYYQCQVRK